MLFFPSWFGQRQYNAPWHTVQETFPRRDEFVHEKEKPISATELCVIFNPAAARGRASGKIENLRRALGDRARFLPTERSGHGEELALEAARSGVGTVAAAGGDGTVHEVANGLLRAQVPEVAFAVFPLGSANDYAYSLQRLPPAAGETPHIRRVDVARVKGANRKERFFVNTLGLGFSGAVALESRQIRRLQGLALYSLAFFRALWFRYDCPVMGVTVDGAKREAATLSLTIALGIREGSFIVAPDARLDDGKLDYLHVGCLSRLQVLRFMPRLARGGQLPSDHPHIWLGRCQKVEIESEAPLIVHLDGEFFCRPEDDLRRLECQILPGAMKVRDFAAEIDMIAKK